MHRHITAETTLRRTDELHRRRHRLRCISNSAWRRPHLRADISLKVECCADGGNPQKWAKASAHIEGRLSHVTRGNVTCREARRRRVAWRVRLVSWWRNGAWPVETLANGFGRSLSESAILFFPLLLSSCGQWNYWCPRRGRVTSPSLNNPPLCWKKKLRSQFLKDALNEIIAWNRKNRALNIPYGMARYQTWSHNKLNYESIGDFKYGVYPNTRTIRCSPTARARHKQHHIRTMAREEHQAMQTRLCISNCRWSPKGF